MSMNTSSAVPARAALLVTALLVTALLLTALLVTALLVPLSAAEPAFAASERGGDCVTRAEYRQARHGMTPRRVHRIFGTAGQRVYLVYGNEEKRAYPMCDPSLRLTVTYLHGELGYKHLRG